jgi:hypothetical protein
MYLTGKSLPRRAILKGLGVSIALPFLDAMTPAVGAFGRAAAAPSATPTAATPKRSPRRKSAATTSARRRCS